VATNIPAVVSAARAATTSRFVRIPRTNHP
jgi:hypothetical protein